MLPIGDDNSARRTVPVVTYALIAINVLFFLVELTAGNAFIEKYSVIPNQLLANPLAEFITVFTAMFMHAGWLHLGGNMLSLWIFGDNLEQAMGHVRFLDFYLLCGLAAALCPIVFSGASSACTV